MTKIYLVFYILAAVCFFISMFWGGNYGGNYGSNAGNTDGGPGNRVGRVNLISLGLLFWVFVPLIQIARVV